ncbi:hypothetical protein BBO99_00006899 [Phytophthora kernoviae]|uniref:Uncharacterized protein n=2 Tax=Phytophthora kernoviae TaxID=325452 RepID=A0A3R7GU00_9STRA|nr:hypothetical protein G195_007791 [Phytophthora kernoviae 00238/432]KAG2520539.1 hypothetical protein JM16_006686 [Phytophthora kernoviae]KAG2522227.1 hypothetical protein JM18_006269 [Phytophthora kernoviae]RLN44099.1 hypothetical protein BBI17_006999 [Phytophthora kernoviae]RLN77240.1 hypothetical protein BBO99_00006899 [Phytophthora kernoviae]
MAPEELDSADPERGAMAPPSADKPDDDPELLWAVAESSDDELAEAEVDLLVESEAVDSDADEVTLLDPDADADADAVSLLLLEETRDDAVLAAALALEEATAEVAEAVEFEVGEVVAAETLATANAARTSHPKREEKFTSILSLCHDFGCLLEPKVQVPPEPSSGLVY